MATTRDDIQRLLDDIPDERLAEAHAYLALLTTSRAPGPSDPPEDDEPITEDDIAALEAYRAERARGETVSHDEVKRVMGW